MTTTRYLWIGFGSLIALLLASTLIIVKQIGSMDREVREMADARNFSAAAAQLESDTLRYALNVRAFLQTGDRRSLHEMDAAARAVDQHLGEYRRLSEDDRRSEIAPKFGPAWHDLKALGETLVNLPASEPTSQRSQQLLDLRFQVQEMLAGNLRADALSVYNDRKDEALRDVRTGIQVAWVLLFGGAAIALSISLVVARAIVQSEKRLWAHSELLHVTLNSIGDGVIATDTRGCVTFLNPAAASLTGWSSREAMGQPLESIVQITQDATQESADRGENGYPVRHLIDRQGDERPVDDKTAPIRDEQGRIIGAVMICRDNTERHRLESELRRHVADIAETDRRKSEFLSMLSHELRNPIAPIRNALQILRLRIAEAPGLQPVVSMMERQIGHMVRLIDDLLDLSRISRGKIDLRLEPTDLSSVLQLAVEAVAPQLESMNHDLAVKLPSQPVMVLADPARLAQIVCNLLNNAAKFTDRGGRITLEADVEEDRVVIRVSDSGIGISERQLPHVFDLYMQVDSSLQRSGSGIGIGLALVKNLVDLHGGTVTAQSGGPGTGSEFTVRLPRHTGATADVVATDADPSSFQATPRRILIVDDNRDAAASLSILLEIDGHTTRTAADGEEALQLVESWGPDVIFLDIGLPRLTGYDVARVIRAQPWGASILLFALTGWGQEADRQRTAEAGFDAHLVKPATRNGLATLLSLAATRQGHPSIEGA